MAAVTRASRFRQGAGSGFVIDPRGYILTNNHVVEGAFNIRVKFDDGRTLEAEVLGRDPLTDIALIKLKSPPANLPVLRLGDSDAMRVGDWVVAIGNPFGLASSVSAGILSAKAREIRRDPVRRLPADRRRHQPRQLRAARSSTSAARSSA